MASFDFVECTAKSYRFIWEKRVDVLRLSLMALAVKILIFVALVVFGLQQDILRQGLFSLPAYLLEGWVIAQLMVMALYGQEPERGQAFKLPPPEDIERNVKASMIVYVLTKLMLSFVVGSTFNAQEGLPDTQPPDPSLQIFFMAMMMLVFMIWSFRFLWLYVPFILGCHPIDFLRRFQAFSSSFYMIGVWILCFVPLIIVMVAVSELMSMILGGLGLDQDTIAFKSGLALIQAVIDYAMSLISSIGIAFGIYSVFKGENKKTDIW